VGFASSFSSASDFTSFKFIYGLFFFSLPANLFLYGINDLFDSKTDILNDKKGKFENLFLVGQKKLYVVGVFISLLLSLPLFLVLSTNGRIFLSIFLFLCFFYSAPPLRFKARIFLDFLSNFLYVLPSFVAVLYFNSTINFNYLVIASWFWVSAMHLFSAIPDIKADKEAGIATSAVLLGEKLSLYLVFIFWFLTFFLVSAYSIHLSVSIIYPLMVVYTIFNVKKIKSIYWYFPYINLLIGFLLFWYVVLF